jgi:hypothetical protein
MAGQVNILGDGLAACCSAHLLSQQGFALCVQRSSRLRPARLLLSEQTQLLLRETFNAPHLFKHAPQIRRRIVSWGDEAPVELPHRGIVVSEQELLGELWQRVVIPNPASSSTGAIDPIWTIASLPNPDSLPKPRNFGARFATATMVELAGHSMNDCCWVESLPDGWLFLLASGEGRGVLISAGYSPERLLEQSRLIARQVSILDVAVSPEHRFPAFPQILSELCGPGWLACGSAAMTFDPLCGEGAGHAVREAILASAIIRASAKGSPTESFLSHYKTRLMRGFLRHLQVCLPFYLGGGSTTFWKTEAAALQKGIACMQDQLQNHTPPRYRLAGYELQPITGEPAQ